MTDIRTKIEALLKLEDRNIDLLKHGDTYWIRAEDYNSLVDNRQKLEFLIRASIDLVEQLQHDRAAMTYGFEDSSDKYYISVRDSIDITLGQFTAEVERVG